MKNLDKWRKKEYRLLILTALIVLIPIAAAVLLYICSPGLLGDSWPTVITVLALLCWLAAFLVMGRIFRKIVIIRAMTENGIRLKTDRAFYPSKRQDVSLSAIQKSFSDAGYCIGTAEDGFCASRQGKVSVQIFVREDADNAAAVLKQMAQTYRYAPSRRQKRAYAVCFLTHSITAEQRELSRDVIAIEGGCIMPVFYDVSQSRAYYMGGFTGGVEEYLQAAIKEILLCYDGEFPQKTDSDVTDEEKEFNALDLDEIFAQMRSVPSQDKDVIVHMENEQVKLVGDDQNGVIYYKTDNIGFAQMYSVTEACIRIDALENLYICSPKVKKADFEMTLRFKKAVEDYLDQIGQPYYY